MKENAGSAARDPAPDCGGGGGGHGSLAGSSMVRGWSGATRSRR